MRFLLFLLSLVVFISIEVTANAVVQDDDNSAKITCFDSDVGNAYCHYQSPLLPIDVGKNVELKLFKIKLAQDNFYQNIKLLLNRPDIYRSPRDGLSQV